MLILVSFLLILFLYWFHEYRIHKKDLNDIPIRIHVNGTRGKSSVTRLIAAALRGGGVNTIAKTTGTNPRIILNDHNEVPILRLSGANIIEQIKVINYASLKKPKAIVIECMAVNPMLQWIAEHKMVKATHSVITNSRPDHLDQMGPTLLNVTKSLANTIAYNAKFYTSEKKMAYIFKKICAKRKTDFIKIDESLITNEDMSKFRYIEHKENVTLALALAMECGVSKEDALHGMHSAFPDPGALEIFLIRERNMELRFVNALAANDPESTVMIWHLVENEIGFEGFKVIILNTRSDRFFRTEQLLEVIQPLNYDMVAIVGDETESLNKLCDSLGFDRDKIANLGDMKPKDLFEFFINLDIKANENGKKVVDIIGVGNIHGTIEPFVKILREKRIKDW